MPPPIKDEGVFRQIRNEWVDFLQAIPYFEDVTILTEDTADIKNEHDRALGVSKVNPSGTSGTCVVLMTVTAVVSDTGEFGPVYDNIKMMARAYENVVQNRGPNGTGKTYEAIAEKIAGYTHGQFAPSTCNGNKMIHVPPGIVLGNDPNWPCKDAFFSVPGSLAIVLPQVAGIAFAVNNGVVTISTQTAGAAIFYTFDGKRPSPRGNSSQLYLAPIAPPAGTRLKARAYLAGYLDSETASVQL